MAFVACGRLANLPQVLLKYRIHPTSTSALHRAQQATNTAAISIQGICQSGWAVDAAQAAAFRAFPDLTGDPHAFDHSALAFLAVLGRFVDWMKARGSPEGVAALRRAVRWQLIACRARVPKRSVWRARLIWHALSLDPPWREPRYLARGVRAAISMLRGQTRPAYS